MVALGVKRENRKLKTVSAARFCMTTAPRASGTRKYRQDVVAEANQATFGGRIVVRWFRLQLPEAFSVFIPNGDHAFYVAGDHLFVRFRKSYCSKPKFVIRPRAFLGAGRGLRSLMLDQISEHSRCSIRSHGDDPIIVLLRLFLRGIQFP